MLYTKLIDYGLLTRPIRKLLVSMIEGQFLRNVINIWAIRYREPDAFIRLTKRKISYKLMEKCQILSLVREAILKGFTLFYCFYC